ncbi:peptidase associated/transthyretin-like domain-containing protein [Calditrichota bacterium LG25]
MKNLIIIIVLLTILGCKKDQQALNINNSKKYTIYGSIMDSETGELVNSAIVKALYNHVSDTTDSSGHYYLELQTDFDTLIVTAQYYDTLYKEIHLSDTESKFDLQIVKKKLICTPVEDTSRVYYWYIKNITTGKDTIEEIELYPRGLFVRFYPAVTDTHVIMNLIRKYDLKLYKNDLSIFENQWAASICIPDSLKRAECFFTPYGKKNIKNFGNEDIVEYCFGIFNGGTLIPTGTISFLFKDNFTETQIDSFFNANGLRFITTYPYYPYNKKFYMAVVTPDSRLNVLDLGIELSKDKNVYFLDVGMGFSPPRDCN